MGKSVTFFYDYGSPTCYLAWTQLAGICEKNSAAIIKKPILLGGLFKAIGHVSPITLKPKAVWMFADLARYAKHYGVPFQKPKAFPLNSVPPMRAAIWASRADVLDVCDRALFKAAWVDGLDIGDIEILKDVLAVAGLDSGDMAEAIQSPSVKSDLVNATNEAVAAGAFGVPTFLVNEVLHFGQDRLPWIERAVRE